MDKCCIIVFVFIDSATTEIITSLHTLPLHAALPIFPDAVQALIPPSSRRRFDLPAATSCSRALVARAPDWHTSTTLWSRAARSETCSPSRSRGTRSEEHTSELQSLLRISYAVLCLKKTNTQVRKTDEKIILYR